VENNHVRVLKALSLKSPRTSRELADAVGAWPGRTPHLAAVRVNAILDVEQRRGHVARAGFTRSNYKNVHAFLWKITPAGQAWLEAEPWTQRGRNLSARKARAIRNRAWDSALIEYLDREARAHDWSHETPAAERKAAICQMRAMGCTLQAIADVFGITGEYVRLIQQGHMVRNGKSIPVGSDSLTRREGHLVFTEKEKP